MPADNYLTGTGGFLIPPGLRPLNRTSVIPRRD